MWGILFCHVAWLWPSQCNSGIRDHVKPAASSRCLRVPVLKPKLTGWSISLRSLFLSPAANGRRAQPRPATQRFSPPLCVCLPSRAFWLRGAEASSSRSTVPASPPAATSDRQGGQLSCVNDAVVTVCRRGGAEWPAKEARNWKTGLFWTLTHARWLGAGSAFSFFCSTTNVLTSISGCWTVALICCEH